MKLLLNPQYALYERNGQAFCDSLMVSASFNKRHDNVLADVRNLDCSENFRLLNFQESNYKNQQNKRQPMYLMTKDGFTFLVMGYTGKKAAAFKESYITRFNQMETFIMERLISTKEVHPALMDAIKEAHAEPKPYHYTNEINMIYCIVLGVNAKQYRTQNSLPKGESIKPHLTLEQIKAVEALQRIDVGLHEAGLSYDERKRILAEKYQKRQRKNALLTIQS